MAERTLSKRSAGGACGAGAAAGEEARLCAMAQTKRKPNYHAARQCATAIYCLAAAVVAMDRGWYFGGSSQSSVECPWRRAAGAPTPDVDTHTHTGCPATRAKQTCITHTLALEHCVQFFR